MSIALNVRCVQLPSLRTTRPRHGKRSTVGTLTCWWLTSIVVLLPTSECRRVLISCSSSSCPVFSGANVYCCRTNNRHLSVGVVTSITTQHTKERAPVGDVVVKIDGQIVGRAECSQRQHCYVLRTPVVTAVMSCCQLHATERQTHTRNTRLHRKFYLLCRLFTAVNRDRNKTGSKRRC